MNWHYISCTMCSKKATEENDTYTCVDHGPQLEIAYRYHCNISFITCPQNDTNFNSTVGKKNPTCIQDQSATTPFTFFTVAADDVIGCTCPEFIAMHNADNPQQTATKILAIEGQKYVFQFHFNTSGKMMILFFQKIQVNWQGYGCGNGYTPFPPRSLNMSSFASERGVNGVLKTSNSPGD
ncbi:nucleic acid-binding, OB-fold protein [Tanacetum coccineum]|uniref:Nucleic acid-binding, OB-fold protein n=1 Tax=Tanacetum coccineum TaxID=301880 RepID=A0ABQ5FU99_9ASTR